MPLRFATHSKRVQKIAVNHGWKPSARYTNLRDVKDFAKVEFIDIDFKNYNFDKHYFAVKKHEPHLTVAMDVFDINQLDKTIRDAELLNKYSDKVIIVPKDLEFKGQINKLIPKKYILGYSAFKIWRHRIIAL